MGEVPPPSKRRKILSAEPPPSSLMTPYAWTVEKREKFNAMFGVLKESNPGLTDDNDDHDDDDLAILLQKEWIKLEQYPHLSVQEIKKAWKHNQQSASASSHGLRVKILAENGGFNNVVEEVADEFAPDHPQVEPALIKVEKSICDKYHWVHLFSDKDVNVECILTEQLLEIRQSLKDSFQGCDIYKPKKPKGNYIYTFIIIPANLILSCSN
jgi:hypothetical protein